MFAGVGERSREGNDLYREMEESGVLDKTVLVFGQMNEPPGARCSCSAFLRFQWLNISVTKKTKRYSFCSLITFFRFTQAGSELSALLGRMPSAVGYQPTLATEMGQLQERITSTKRGLLHLFKQCMYLRMTLLTQLLRRHFLTLTQQ